MNVGQDLAYAQEKLRIPFLRQSSDAVGSLIVAVFLDRDVLAWDFLKNRW